MHDAESIMDNAQLRAGLVGARSMFTREQLDTFDRIEHSLQRAANYADAYGGCVVDGTQYSPSDRAIDGVERVWQDCSDEQWTHFQWALDDLYDALDLVWIDGVLWRSDDAPFDAD